jgi:predicted TIM-barrel fold metal-dependent hydrolase
LGPDDTTTDPDDTSSSSWLPWVLAALVAAGVIAAILVQRSRRRAALETRTRHALAQTADLSRSLATVAPTAAQVVAAQDAARLAALGVELQAIAAETADDAAKQAIDQVRAQVQVLHGVTDSVALSAVPPSDAAGAYLREQATVLHTVATRAMAQLYPPPTP